MGVAPAELANKTRASSGSVAACRDSESASTVLAGSELLATLHEYHTESGLALANANGVRLGRIGGVEVGLRRAFCAEGVARGING